MLAPKVCIALHCLINSVFKDIKRFQRTLIYFDTDIDSIQPSFQPSGYFDFFTPVTSLVFLSFSFLRLEMDNWEKKMRVMVIKSATVHADTDDGISTLH